ncbi:MAG: ParB/RepB/Spo0J family partition protein [Clostridiales bacterium]|jgi:ParB family chromosome partitioning protein|nr:ParB/RepB/Spo0J family partition protein [Clostridiales bacterium]
MLFSSKDNKVRQIPVIHICPNESQPRTEFSREDLLELSSSIKTNGVLQPLTVRKGKQNKYELIAGERRLRASILAGLDTVPCIVIQCDDAQSAVFALLENLQRVDLGPFEEAEGIDRLIKAWGITQEEAAHRLGKKQSTIANKLRLLKLNGEERRRIVEEGLTERHARALLRLKSSEDRQTILTQVIQKGLNVHQTETLIDQLLENSQSSEKKELRRTVIIKDVRLFMNTISKAVDTMRLSGIPAVTTQNETDDYIECVVRIPKAAATRRRVG